ncbi:Threonyl/alanyl tRNA synthetase [Bisporella sp. PMI_857]|nr:Threonyl/alanyl tRNA synthetase [Bisporella sp. PMI_857]
MACVVGALACQKDSYLRSLETKVISCTKATPANQSQASSKKKKAPQTNPSDVWHVEFADSVLFPEGGGQPTDHGILYVPSSSDPIPVTVVERQGLRCICHSPQELEPGSLVRQEIDFDRRWDHMQQHTGQHLLSAIAETRFGLKTVGWGMGQADEQCYVDLSGKPSPDDIQIIQTKCNEIIRNNLSIRVETPDDANAPKLPGDYDKEKGVVRVVKIGDIDANPCCGTHLSQTSHLSLILLHSTQTVHSTNCRLYFSVGDRAINLTTKSLRSLRSIAQVVNTGARPDDILEGVKKTSTAATDLKGKEKRLLAEIAKFEAARVKSSLEQGKNAWVHRPTDGLDFINMIVFEVKDVAKADNLLVLATGEDKKQGQVVIIGDQSSVEDFAAKALKAVSSLKGGGRGERWQGKVIAWQKGEIDALKALVES